MAIIYFLKPTQNWKRIYKPRVRIEIYYVKHNIQFIYYTLLEHFPVLFDFTFVSRPYFKLCAYYTSIAQL